MRQFIKITYILTKKNTGAKNSTVSWRHFLLKDVFSTTISKKKPELGSGKGSSETLKRENL